MFDSKARFLEFIKPEYYKRVDNEHPLDFFIGLNTKGQKTLKLRGAFTYQHFVGTSCIEVKQLKSETRITLSFSLINDDATSLFYKFCDDLIEETRLIFDVNVGYRFVVNRFLLWKKLFVSKKNILSEVEIIGLIGELLFLTNTCFQKYGMHESLIGWTGMEPTHKDFSFKNYWYEVKTKHVHIQTIKISSLEQLDSPLKGELIVVDLERMSPEFNGLKLNKLVIDIRTKLSNIEDADLLDYKLGQAGYQYNDDYDDYSYELKKISRYSVTNQFPRILRNNIDDRIQKIQYEISVNALTDFMVEE